MYKKHVQVWGWSILSSPPPWTDQLPPVGGPGHFFDQRPSHFFLVWQSHFFGIHHFCHTISRINRRSATVRIPELGTIILHSRLLSRESYLSFAVFTRFQICCSGWFFLVAWAFVGLNCKCPVFSAIGSSDFLLHVSPVTLRHFVPSCCVIPPRCLEMPHTCGDPRRRPHLRWSQAPPRLGQGEHHNLWAGILFSTNKYTGMAQGFEHCSDRF